MTTTKLDLDNLEMLYTDAVKEGADAASDAQFCTAARTAMPELLRSARVLALIKDCDHFARQITPNRPMTPEEMAAEAAKLDQPAQIAAPVNNGWGSWREAASKRDAEAKLAEAGKTFSSLISRALACGISTQQLADTVVSVDTIERWADGRATVGPEIQKVIVKIIREKASYR